MGFGIFPNHPTVPSGRVSKGRSSHQSCHQSLSVSPVSSLVSPPVLASRSHKCSERMNTCLGLITTIPKNGYKYRQNYITSPSVMKIWKNKNKKKNSEKKSLWREKKNPTSQFLFWVIKIPFCRIGNSQ